MDRPIGIFDSGVGGLTVDGLVMPSRGAEDGSVSVQRVGAEPASWTSDPCVAGAGGEDRGAGDGVPATGRGTGDRIVISVTHEGQERSVVCSPHNAWRLLGMLSHILGVPLSREAQKAIRF